MGKLETDSVKINRRVNGVRAATAQSIRTLLMGYRRKHYAIRHAALVVGSQVDPASIANPHIRAHAFEGKLFRTVLEEALHAHRVRTAVLLEREIYDKAAAQLKKSSDEVGGTIRDFGRFSSGPWCVEQKLAALAAWMALD